MAKVRSNILIGIRAPHEKTSPFKEETCIQRRRLKCIPRNTELRGKFRHAIRHAIIMRNKKRNTGIADTKRIFRNLQTLPNIFFF